MCSAHFKNYKVIFQIIAIINSSMILKMKKFVLDGAYVFHTLVNRRFYMRLWFFRLNYVFEIHYLKFDYFQFSIFRQIDEIISVLVKPITDLD